MACDIYSIYNPTLGPLVIDYTDCNGNNISEFIPINVFVNRCILEITDIDSSLTATNIGPCDNCRCNTVQNTGLTTEKFRYVDCNDDLITSADIGPNSYIQICAKTVSFDLGGDSWSTSTGNTCTDNKCPCKCYYIVADTESSTIVRYFDCDSVATAQEILPNSGLYKTCGTFDIVGTLYDSGSLCVVGNCPTFFCQCYTVTNNGETTDVGVAYLDCNNQIVTQVINPTETYSFCAQNVQYLDNIGNVLPNFPVDFSVTNSGDCFNGQCVSSLSIEDQLLLDILAKYGPCPGICDGSTPVGGPAGTNIIDIKNGGIIGSTN